MHFQQLTENPVRTHPRGRHETKELSQQPVGELTLTFYVSGELKDDDDDDQPSNDSSSDDSSKSDDSNDKEK